MTTSGRATAQTSLKVDAHGEKVDPSPYPINPAGFVIHSAIHAAREDATCVMHVHSVNGIAVSAHFYWSITSSAAFIPLPHFGKPPRLLS